MTLNARVAVGVGVVLTLLASEPQDDEAKSERALIQHGLSDTLAEYPAPLPAVLVEERYPSEDGWRTQTYYLKRPEVGCLEIVLREARLNDLALAATVVASTSEIVFAYRVWVNDAGIVAGEAEIAVVEDGRLARVTQARLPAPALPSPSAVKAMGESTHRGGRGSFRLPAPAQKEAATVRVMSWNGRFSHGIARARHPDYLGFATIGVPAGEQIPEGPLRSWPEPVWFLQMRLGVAEASAVQPGNAPDDASRRR